MAAPGRWPVVGSVARWTLSPSSTIRTPTRTDGLQCVTAGCRAADAAGAVQWSGELPVDLEAFDAVPAGSTTTRPSPAPRPAYGTTTRLRHQTSRVRSVRSRSQ